MIKSGVLLTAIVALTLGCSPQSASADQIPGLRGHDRKPDGGPTDARVALQILLEAAARARLPKSIRRDRQQRRQQDDVVEPVHEK